MPDKRSAIRYPMAPAKHPGVQEDSTDTIRLSLQKSSDIGNYIGFSVIRPIGHAPIGRAVFRSPIPQKGLKPKVLVSSEYNCHLFGAKLSVTGLPYTQQDSRVGACAQSAIWSAGRHFHNRHKGKWISIPEITELATQINDIHISRSLPAGSDFLHDDNIVRALKGMDRIPRYYPADKYDHEEKVASWIQQRPKDVIHRYVDSGIPTMLGLGPIADESDGHAVIANGANYRMCIDSSSLPHRPTMAEFVDSFIVCDDQRGPNSNLAMDEYSIVSDSSYEINTHLIHIIPPLPDKVFITGEVVEKISWDFLESQYPLSAPQIVKGPNFALTDNTKDLVADATNGIQTNKILARTYLTYGWKYKHRMLQNTVAEDLKSFLVSFNLPKFVWITEFGLFDDLNDKEKNQQRIIGHSVMDATSSHLEHALLLFHFPGLAFSWWQNLNSSVTNYDLHSLVLNDDQKYLPKINGPI